MPSIRAHVDFVRFSTLVSGALGDVSLRQAAQRPGLNAGMLSRAINAKTLSASSYLSICRAFNLDPWECFFLRPMAPDPPARSVSDIVGRLKRYQSVTEHVDRETRGQADA